MSVSPNFSRIHLFVGCLVANHIITLVVSQCKQHTYTREFLINVYRPEESSLNMKWLHANRKLVNALTQGCHIKGY